MKRVIEFLRDDSGQTSTEYILLVAVVAVIIFKFKDILQQRLMSLAEGVFGNAEGLLNQMQ